MTTDTPEVDAAAYEERGLPGSQVVHADFARRIARDCNQAHEDIEILTREVDREKGKLEIEQAAHEATKKNLETSLNHAADVSEILDNLCAGLSLPEVKHAPEALQWAQDFRKRGEVAEAARLKAEVEQTNVWTAACDSANARVTALLQQVADLNIHAESLQELNFELAANAARVEECCNTLVGVTDKLLAALPPESKKVPA